MREHTAIRLYLINPSNPLVSITKVKESRLTRHRQSVRIRVGLSHAGRSLMLTDGNEEMHFPAAERRGIGGIRTMIIPPHPALSRKGRGNMVTLKQSFEESID